jgi:hypothetical protein
MSIQRMSLEDAGKHLGVSANAVRARAKKNPDLYGLETDNTGKLWVKIDLQNAPSKKPKLKPSKANSEDFNAEQLKALIEASRTQIETAVLEERIKSLETLLAEMRDDRDAWRAMAQKPWWKLLVG